MKKCPQCAEMIQDDARKCRFCHTTLTDPMQAGDQHVVTERTSKAIKKRMMFCLLAFIVGFFLLIMGKEGGALPGVGILLMIGSVGYYIYLRFQRWWHHG